MKIQNANKYFDWLRATLKFDEGLDQEAFERAWTESLLKKYDQGEIGYYTLHEFFSRTGKAETIRYRIKKGRIVF